MHDAFRKKQGGDGRTRLDRGHLSQGSSLGDGTEEDDDEAKDEGLGAAIEEGKIHVSARSASRPDLCQK